MCGQQTPCQELKIGTAVAQLHILEPTEVRLAAVHLLGLLEGNVVLGHVVHRRGTGDQEPVRKQAAVSGKGGEVCMLAFMCRGL